MMHDIHCQCDRCCIRRWMQSDAWVICVQCGQKYRMGEHHTCPRLKRVVHFLRRIFA